MSRRRESEPLEKITVSVFKSDMERIRALYATAGHNKAIRLILRRHLNDVDAKAAEMVETMGV